MTDTPVWAWPVRPKFQDRRWLHALLLIITLVSTVYVGAFHYAGFEADFLDVRSPAFGLWFLARGLWYSVPILAILGAHEMGHYLACRYYDVDASLPYFIPMPILMTGTMGAFIRIREPIPTKRMLFDIGIAGPIAGFIVAVPTLVAGLALSHMVRIPDDFVGMELGEPLLFKLASFAIWGSSPTGYSLNLHPLAFAAWFGLLATALNLFPIGQLDGGHIAYAVFGRRSSHITLGALGVAIALTAFSSSWIVWTVLLVVMLMRFGRHHPPTFDEHEPLDRARLVLAVVALMILVVSFTPAPIEPLDVITR